MVGEGVCVVKTLTRNHLYCEPPSEQPVPRHQTKREGTDPLPEFTVQMGNLNFLLGRVQYDTESLLTFPLQAQIGLGIGASFVALIVVVIVFIYRRKSKQALRDYKKVQIQLENLETSVRDRCKKEFTGESCGALGGEACSPLQPLPPLPMAVPGSHLAEGCSITRMPLSSRSPLGTSQPRSTW
uniref:Uncharacterized protein n=1 Tax=Sphenodon punctatus TaxID=8508 RepID=A0A8D0GQB3_SPHPU